MASLADLGAKNIQDGPDYADDAFSLKLVIDK